MAREIFTQAAESSRIASIPTLTCGPRVGFALAEANLKRDREATDNAYKALHGLVSKALVDAKANDALEVAFATRSAVQLHPVLVIEAPLVEVFHVPNEPLHVAPVKRARLSWYGADARMGRPTIVDVVTADDFPNYLADAKSAATAVLSLLADGLRVVDQTLQKPRTSRQRTLHRRVGHRSSWTEDEAAAIASAMLEDWKPA